MGAHFFGIDICTHFFKMALFLYVFSATLVVWTFLRERGICLKKYA